ncbi:MAG TPA: ABC transporter substrate-binding protein [Candidatus Binatia bacterium]|nr:ABC transporter substrate-binding protein [Candidatus Binatia bacterium]
MKTQVLGLALCALLYGICLPAEAQQPKKTWRVGFLSSVSAEPSTHMWTAFLQGLRDRGYVEGRNVVIEQRWAEGKTDRLPDMAAELVRLNVDVIVSTGGTVTAFAAKNATATIPIVFTVGGDLVKLGLVASLARPGGNLTGLSLLTSELNSKRLELLKETIADLRRTGVIGNPTNPNYAIHLYEAESAAKQLGLQLYVQEARSNRDISNGFSTLAEKKIQALLVLSDPMLNSNRQRITHLAIEARFPAIYEFKEFVEAGGLMSYGTDIVAVYRRIGAYLDKIFKGTKPSELPIEQPTKFDFVVNLKTAKQIGLTIPPNVLARADRVIK